MNTYTLRVRYVLLTLACGLFITIHAHAQMKIGNHPTQIHPASILELESNNQALRLTQGDTLEVNNIIASDPAGYKGAEGMIMYNTGDSSVYIRMNGWWHKVLDAETVPNNFWKLTGNAATADSNFLGTTNATELHLGTDSTAAIIITGSGLVQIVDSLEVNGNAHFLGDTVQFDHFVNIADSLNVAGALKVTPDTVYTQKPLFIQDSLIIQSLGEALSTDKSVLVIGADGVVRKMTLDAIGIRSIAGLTGPKVSIDLQRDSTDFFIDSTSSANTLTFYMPYAGTSSNGLVDTVAQSFAGAKSFRDSIAIGGLNTPSSTLDVQGNVSMKTVFVSPLGDYDMFTTSDNANVRTIVYDVSGIATATTYTVTLPAATTVGGRIYTIKKIGDADDGQLNQNIEIVPSGTDTFGDGGNSYFIYNNFSSVTLQSKNGNWYIVK